MKVDIRHCPKCDRDTLQALTGVPQGYTFEGTVYKNGWFCSLCGKYWRNVKKEVIQEMIPH